MKTLKKFECNKLEQSKLSNVKGGYIQPTCSKCKKKEQSSQQPAGTNTTGYTNECNC